MKILCIGLAVFAFSLFDDPYKLAGRWQTPPSPAGNITRVVFTTDSTFEAFVNRKPFTSGRFTRENDVFSFTDNGCMGLRGVYRLVFFSEGDSLRFAPLTDSCEERKQGMSRMVLGRVKE